MFQLSLVPVVDQIDSGIDVAVADLRVGGNVRAPLLRVVADKIIGLAWERVQPIDGWMGIRANQFHPQDCLVVLS